LRELRPFDAAHAPLVSSWIRTRAEAAAWASLTDIPVTPELLARWHAEDDVHPFLLYEDEVDESNRDQPQRYVWMRAE
jgi:hypothetical protein